MIQLKVRKDLSEIINYNIKTFPVYCRMGTLSKYPNYSAICHWHINFEFNYVLKGEMNFYVDGQEYTVREGECIFINSNRLHYGYSREKRECEFICFTFSPSVLDSCEYASKKFILPFYSESNVKSMLLRRDGGWQEKITDTILSVYSEFENLSEGFELEVLSDCWKIFNLLRKNCDERDEQAVINSKDNKSLKNMLLFIQQHFTEKCSLEDIARAGAVCRSKCFQIFKNNMHTTPINFLTDFRLNKSIELLASDKSITEIAYDCGFCSTSYYIKIFGAYFNCTPNDYRKQSAYKNH